MDLGFNPTHLRSHNSASPSLNYPKNAPLPPPIDILPTAPPPINSEYARMKRSKCFEHLKR